MTEHTTDRGLAQAYVELRRARLAAACRRPLAPVGAGSELLPRERIAHLLREAQEVYWNELAWEQLTDEEVIAGGHLTELVFPALLTFVDGLLMEDRSAGACPHPDAVERILTFLGDRYTAFTAELRAGADSERLVWARAMTSRLIDLVLYRLYGLSPQECEELEAAG